MLVIPILLLNFLYGSKVVFALKCSGPTTGRIFHNFTIFKSEIECAMLCSTNTLCSSYLFKDSSKFLEEKSNAQCLTTNEDDSPQKQKPCVSPWFDQHEGKLYHGCANPSKKRTFYCPTQVNEAGVFTGDGSNQQWGFCSNNCPIDGKEKFFTDGKYGGSGGGKWSDSVVKDNGNITKIELKEGGTINAIRVRYGNIWGDWHGVGGGSLQSIELNPGEHIKVIKGRQGGAVDGIEFHSSDNQVYGPYGGNGGSLFESSKADCYLSYLSGAAGAWIDSFTFHFICDIGAPKPNYYSSNCLFLDEFEDNFMATVMTLPSGYKPKMKIRTLGSAGGFHTKFISPPNASIVEENALKSGFDQKITFSNGMTKFYKFIDFEGEKEAWYLDRYCGTQQGVLPIIYEPEDAEILRKALSPSLSTLLLGLKLIQPNWNDNGQNKDLVQAIYMNGQVDFSTDEGKRGYECPKYGGPRFSDWSDVDKILTEESVSKRIFFVHDSGTMDFRNRAFGTIKWTIGNKVACEFLGSRNFALEGKAGVYKNAELVEAKPPEYANDGLFNLNSIGSESETVWRGKATWSYLQISFGKTFAFKSFLILGKPRSNTHSVNYLGIYVAISDHTSLQDTKKIQESNDLKLCAIYPVTLNIEEKSMGGITCQGGMMAGNYLYIQNTIKEPNLRLSEISAFGYEF